MYGAAVVSLLLASTVALLVRQRTLALVRAQLSDEARRESEERFRALFNQTTVGVAQVDSDTGQFVRVNQRYADILGYGPQELVGMTFQSLTHPDDVAADLAQARRLQNGDVPEYRLEKRYIHRDGHEVWGDLTVSSMWASGSAPGYHIAVVQDITGRKRMEENLRANEQRLRSILERLPMGLCLVQDDGLISFRNARYVQICGYTQEEVPDTNTWWQRAYPDATEREAIRRRLLDTSHQGIIPLAEYTIRCADGKYKPVEISGIFVEGGRLITMQDLSERKAAEEEINQLAYYDPLTRLPNRRLLMDRLQQALATSARHHRSGALLMLDLDNFKTVNETRGHDRGDALLLQVAHRLRSCVHEDDTVARQGGDEFVVVLEDLGDSPEEAAARAEDVGQRILGVLREPYQIDGDAHHSSLSMGVTIYSGTRETVDELLKRADLALYQAKNAGRDTLRFYDPQMQAVVSARATLELDMRVGLAQGQFELYYQPQIDHGRIIGAEALLRWRHPRDGFISPAHFIPLAEETGLILPLGEWVLRTACAQCAAWQQDGPAPLRIAVNVSGCQFNEPDFVDMVSTALSSSGLSPEYLELELTESLLISNEQQALQKLQLLKSMGIYLAIDDFGTGYSSLAYLKHFPLDRLKIDKSFINDILTDPDDAAITEAIIAMGHSLKLKVIAEGVETREQLLFLEDRGCDEMQGYYLSKPLSEHDLKVFITARAADSAKETT